MQWIGFSLLGLTLVGCVPQEKYNAARLALEAAETRFASADAQAKAATAESEAYKRQLEALMANGNNANAAFTNISAQYADLKGSRSSTRTR
jgi:hypothetical protein